MPYYTGSASSLGDLLTALQAGCVAEGWTLTGNILSKGTCHVEAKVANLNTTGNLRPALVARGGNSRSGSTLTDEAPKRVFLGTFNSSANDSQIQFPATYHLHIFSSPDEVYFVVNYEIDYYQWLAFGQSPVPGLPGTGNWLGATMGTGPNDSDSGNSANRWTASSGNYRINISDSGGGGNVGGTHETCAALFWDTYWSPGEGATEINSWVHSGLTAGTDNGWGGPAASVSHDGAMIRSQSMISSLVSRQPNAWNGQISLLPIQAYANRASSKWSLAVELGHARYALLDNYAPEDLITLGSDEWKLYPWYRRNVPKTEHDSGRYGWAIRYDGP